ncbi:MAG: S8/S53 family peptidase [Euryarchaeota archaeon]|nr:S8/S53 family peptidase [Euryarchaeota archaeon]
MNLVSTWIIVLLITNSGFTIMAAADAPPARKHAVVAILDTGINNREAWLRSPALTEHPSTYVDGYPAVTSSIDLETQTAAWGRLYWMPGTRIIGAISFGEFNSAIQCQESPDKRRIYDDCGHGSNVSRIAAAQSPDVLIVMVEVGDRRQGLNWAINQPWIDVITMSLGTVANVPTAEVNDLTKRATEQGKIVTNAAGNGATNTGVAPDRNPTYTSEYSGPSWVVTVGAVHPQSRRDHYWHSIPVDVVSPGGSTSYATPVTAGQFARVIAEARNTVGDEGAGARQGNLVVAPPGAPLPNAGPMADGKLNRTELEEVVLKTAQPTPQQSEDEPFPDPEVKGEQVSQIYDAYRDCIETGRGGTDMTTCNMQTPPGIDLPTWRELTGPLPGASTDTTQPPTPVDYVFEGYGIVDGQSGSRAIEVVLGTTPLPERPTEDQWNEENDKIRDAFWNRGEIDNPLPSTFDGFCDIQNPLVECCGDPDTPKLCGRP